LNKFNVALIGRPNVGKSTLFNRLIGKKKAIVSTIPGTTRDRIKGEIDHNDQIINITDVGGFTDDQIDQFSDEIKEQINYSLNNCDLIIMITDGNEGMTSTDKNVAQIIRNTNKKSILVVNKIDSNQKQYNINDFFELGFENILGISAYHNLKIDLLIDEIIDVVLLPCVCTISGLIWFNNFLSLYLPNKDLLPIFLITKVFIFLSKLCEIDLLHIRIDLLSKLLDKSSSTCCSIPAKLSLRTK